MALVKCGVRLGFGVGLGVGVGLLVGALAAFRLAAHYVEVPPR